MVVKMRITRRQLRELINESLPGSGNVAFYYHGSKNPPDVMIPVFLNDSFEARDGNAGAIYAVDEVDAANSTSTGHYGEWIYKLRINLYGFLILDLALAKHVYGEKHMPSDQIMLIVGNHEMANWARAQEVKWQALDVNRKKVYSIINDEIVGKLFKGVVNQHGVAVIYDHSKVIPVGYKSRLEGSFTKVPVGDLRQIKKKIGQSSQVFSDKRGDWDKGMYDFLKDM